MPDELVEPTPQTTATLAEEYDIPEESYAVPTTSASSPPAPPAAKVPPPPPPETPKHSRRVTQMALDLGISQAEIDASNADELDAAVYHANRAVHVERQRQLEETVHHRTTPTTPQPKPAEDEIDWGKDETGQPCSEKDFGQVARFMKQVHDQSKEIKQLKDTLAELTTREMRREDMSNSDRADQAMTNLKNPLIGEKHWSELDKTSSEWNRRVVIFERAKALAGKDADFHAVLRKVPAAAELLFGVVPAGGPAGFPPPPPASRPRDENGRYTKEQEEWLEAGLRRPTHRGNAEEPKGVKRAARKMASLMEEAGLDDDALSKELKDELPD